jgi:hypothetical protein
MNEWIYASTPEQRLATGWTIRGSNPGKGEIFRNLPGQPWIPPTLLYNGYRTILKDNVAGCGGNHLPPPKAEVEESIEL